MTTERKKVVKEVSEAMATFNNELFGIKPNVSPTEQVKSKLATAYEKVAAVVENAILAIGAILQGCFYLVAFVIYLYIILRITLFVLGLIF